MMPGPGIFRTSMPVGFYANGINCGVRNYRPDLGVIYSELPCVAAGVFTQSNCKAAPVKYCEQLLPADNIMAIVTNSGQANAATGKQGVVDNAAMASAVAQALDCTAEQVLTASTGVIGETMAIDKITTAVPELVKTATGIAEKFALAILTTDLVPKTVMKQVSLSTGTVNITGICKGSGMIHPNMATMLGYIITDAQLNTTQAQQILSNVTDDSFNMISVDGETSTNDSVFMLANGASNVALTNENDEKLFQQACLEVAITLAKSIAQDGEGATKLLEVKVKGAKSIQQAKALARSITVSPLIKTALYGESPNWGRIIARIGMEDIAEHLVEACTISCQGQCIYGGDNVDMDKLSHLMKQDSVLIEIDLKGGRSQATAWGCDLSPRYVKINGDYLS